MGQAHHVPASTLKFSLTDVLNNFNFNPFTIRSTSSLQSVTNHMIHMSHVMLWGWVTAIIMCQANVLDMSLTIGYFISYQHIISVTRSFLPCHMTGHVSDSRSHAGLIDEVNLVLHHTRHHSTHFCIHLQPQREEIKFLVLNTQKKYSFPQLYCKPLSFNHSKYLVFPSLDGQKWFSVNSGEYYDTYLSPWEEK